MGARTYKTKDMPLQDGHHRAIACVKTSGNGQEINKTDIMDEEVELHNGHDMTSTDDNAAVLVDEPSGDTRSFDPDCPKRFSSMHSIVMDFRLEDQAAMLKRHPQRYLELFQRAAALEIDSTGLGAFRVMVEQEPNLQYKMAKTYFPAFPFLLLPPAVRAQVAILLIKSGSWEIVGTCKKLLMELGSLVSLHGSCKIVIGSPKHIDPRVLRTDYLQNIMNLKLFVLRTGGSFTSTILDTNMNLLPLFRGAHVIRQRLELTLVGVPGVLWAITEEFFRSLPPIHLFKEFMFNIRVLKPVVDGTSKTWDWRNSTYNSSYNDMVIATKPFEKILGPSILDDEGALFRPYLHRKQGITKAITATSSYSNDQGIFRFSTRQTDTHRRMIYRGKDSQSQMQFVPSPVPLPKPEVAVQQKPRPGMIMTHQNNEWPVFAPATLVKAQQPLTTAPRRASAPDQNESSPQALTVDTSMVDTSIRPIKITCGALKDQKIVANTTPSISIPLERTASMENVAEAMLALATPNPFITPVSALPLAASHDRPKQMTQERMLPKRQYEDLIGHHQSGAPHGSCAKDKYVQIQTLAFETKMPHQHSSTSNLSKKTEHVDLVSPAEDDADRHQAQLRSDTESTIVAGQLREPLVTTNGCLTNSKCENTLQRPILAGLPPISQRSSAPPYDRQIYGHHPQLNVSACRYASIPPASQANTLSVTDHKRKAQALSKPEPKKPRNILPTKAMRCHLREGDGAKTSKVMYAGRNAATDARHQPLDHQ